MNEFASEGSKDQGWDWWIEPETCDLDLHDIGPDEALDYLSDLVIEWQETQK